MIVHKINCKDTKMFAHYKIIRTFAVEKAHFYYDTFSFDTILPYSHRQEY